MPKPRYRRDAAPANFQGQGSSSWQRTLTKLAPVIAATAIGGLHLHQATKSGNAQAVTTAKDALARGVTAAVTSNTDTVAEAVGAVALQIAATPSIGVASNDKLEDASLTAMDTTQAYAQVAAPDFSRDQNAAQVALNAGQKYYNAVDESLTSMKEENGRLRRDLEEARQAQQNLYNMTDQAVREMHLRLNAVAMDSDAKIMQVRQQASSTLAERQNYAHQAALESNSMSMVIGGAPAYMSAGYNAPQTPADPDPTQYGPGVSSLAYQSNLPGGFNAQPQAQWGYRAVVNRPRGGKLRPIA